MVQLKINVEQKEKMFEQLLDMCLNEHLDRSDIGGKVLEDLICSTLNKSNSNDYEERCLCLSMRPTHAIILCYCGVYYPLSL